MTKKRIISFLLVLVLLSGITVPAAMASETAQSSPQASPAHESGDKDSGTEEEAEKAEPVKLHISSVEELKTLARDCRLNSYSENLDVYLDNSLDLTGEGSVFIPSFSGCFYGGGHTISGISASVSGDSKGLFGRIEPDGIVMNLILDGDITADESSTRTGALAGSNYGIIINCSFDGTLKGQEETGGICGYNQGMMLSCTSKGSISGRQKTGGVCGTNSGNLIGCKNYADVNTAEPKKDKKTTDISALSLLGLVSVDDVNTTVDTGGVVGYSDMIVLRCTNYGTVGYPSYGYNVGGVAGRQSNCMSKCTNSGRIYGRNDVGGIVGQAEPFMLLEDRQTLSDEIHALSAAFNTAMNHLNENSEYTAELVVSTGSNLEIMGDQYNTAANDTGYYNDLEGQARRSGLDLEIDGDIREATISARDLSAYEDVLNSVDSTGDAVENVEADQVRDIVNIAQDNGDSKSSIVKTVSDSGNVLDVDTSAVIDRINFRNGEVDLGDTSSMDGVRNKATDADSGYVDEQTLAELESGNIDNVDYNKIIDRAEENGPSDVSDSADYISKQRSERKQEDKQEDKKVENDVYDIAETTSNVEQNISDIGTSVAKAAKDLSKDMEEYNKHMTNALTMVANALSGNLGMNLYNDISELNLIDSANGKILSCENSGRVEGETNVGGIAGSMSIESEYDLEGVISDTLSSEGIFSNTYKTTCVIQNSINRSPLSSVKSNCGGIAGNQGLGYLYQNENYGDVVASEHYAGGVAGRSDAIINTCYSSCDVECKAYAGGIAGMGTVIIDCISLSSIPESVTTFRGAVAGQADVKATRSVDLETGVLAKTVEALLPSITDGETAEDIISAIDQKCIIGNYFVSSNLGGINGISYKGVAEPVSYETVMDYAGLPDNLKTKTIIFRADGVTVKELKIKYGGSVNDYDIPAVPEKEGYTGVWPDFDSDTITNGGIVDAEYLPQRPILESDIRRDDTGLSIFLLEGVFPVGTAVSSRQRTDTSIGGNDVYEAWTVSPKGKGAGTEYSVRYNLPGSVDGRFNLYVNSDDTWHKVSYKTIGSYIEFKGEPGETTFAVTEAMSTGTIVLICLGSAVVLGAAAFFILRGRRKEEHLD